MQAAFPARPEPMPERPDIGWEAPPWNPRELLGVFLAPFGATVLLAVLFAEQFGLHGQAEFLPVQGLQEIVTVAFVLWWVGGTTKHPLRAIGLSRRSWGDVGEGVGMGIVSLVAELVLLGIVLAVAGAVLGHRPSLPRSPFGPIHGLGWISGVLIVGLAAPVAEEFLFRGWLFRGLRARFPFFTSAAISAAAFAFLHGSVIRFIPVFAVGMILASLYERRRSLLATIVAHTTVNAIVVAFVLAR